MPASLNAVFYCQEAPEITVIEGMFHVRYRIGGMDAEFVFKPSGFQRAIASANRALDQFHDNGGSVVKMRKKH